MDSKFVSAKTCLGNGEVESISTQNLECLSYTVISIELEIHNVFSMLESWKIFLFNVNMM